MSLQTKTNKHPVAVTLTGPLHLQKGMKCQDCFAYKQNGNRFVAVVSDGAGTAKFGKIGAKTACETLCDILSAKNLEPSRKNVIFALETAREKLLQHRFNRTKSSEDLINFAATVVGVVYENNKGMFFHIGDGAGIAFFDESMQKFVISKPENGKFLCETYFYTMDDWNDSLRFTDFSNATQICLMTDGVTNFALKNCAKNIESKFIIPVLSFLNNEKSHKKSMRALINTLSTSQAKKISSDDKTFLWARF